MSTKMRCPKCKHTVADDEIVCSYCSTPIKRPKQSQPQPQEIKSKTVSSASRPARKIVNAPSDKSTSKLSAAATKKKSEQADIKRERMSGNGVAAATGAKSARSSRLRDLSEIEKQTHQSTPSPAPERAKQETKLVPARQTGLRRQKQMDEEEIEIDEDNVVSSLDNPPAAASPREQVTDAVNNVAAPAIKAKTVNDAPYPVVMIPMQGVDGSTVEVPYLSTPTGLIPWIRQPVASVAQQFSIEDAQSRPITERKKRRSPAPDESDYENEPEDPTEEEPNFEFEDPSDVDDEDDDRGYAGGYSKDSDEPDFETEFDGSSEENSEEYEDEDDEESDEDEEYGNEYADERNSVFDDYEDSEDDEDEDEDEEPVKPAPKKRKKTKEEIMDEEDEEDFQKALAVKKNGESSQKGFSDGRQSFAEKLMSRVSKKKDDDEEEKKKIVANRKKSKDEEIDEDEEDDEDELETTFDGFDPNEDHYYDDTEPSYEADKDHITADAVLRVLGAIGLVIIVTICMIYMV